MESEAQPIVHHSHSRKAGVLLHITSLPNQQGSGCLDENAWRFVDWMAQAGLKSWQTLPLNHPNYDGSPYNSVSAFAMNPAFLPATWQTDLDAKAFAQFLQSEPHWLQDYALFMAIRHAYQGQPWSQWPSDLKFREPNALAEFAQQHHNEITHLKQQQFSLLNYWHQLRDYANHKGIELYGDMPIFVAYDSADVWAHPEQFILDEQLNPPVVAGVPPDYFSETGQRWGNPHYDWARMQADGFEWWMQRLDAALELFDVVRIDHFRGLQASWQINASEETAINGHWLEVPGEALLKKLLEKHPDMPIIAEDLGLITPEVIALKNEFDLPGMSVLQFGFNGLPDNPHSLDEQVINSVTYTGTHDNDTTLGWFNELDSDTANRVSQSLQERIGGTLNALELPTQMPWPLIVAGALSVAERFVMPMQDLLALDSAHRMNIPGVAEGNWGWQFNWSQVPANLASDIHSLLTHAQR